MLGRIDVFKRKRMMIRLVDVLIVLCAGATTWQAAHLGRRATPSERRARLIQPNMTLTLPDIQWGQASRNVVLLTSTKCEACRKSAEFYRRLSARASIDPDVQLIVVSPDSTADVQKWLDASTIHPEKIVQLKDPVSLGFSLTPTLLLVDGVGLVTDVMHRRLSPGEEEQVLARLDQELARLDVGSAPLNNSDYVTEIDEVEFQRLLVDARPLVLDVRDRNTFKLGHRDGAVNIPYDELDVRAGIELSPSTSIIVDCSAENVTRCRASGRVLRHSGFSQVVLFVP